MVRYSEDGKTLEMANDIEHFTIPDSVTSIGDNAFRDCTSLTSIVIPSSVTSIGDYAFDGCSSLNSIEIPNSVTSIGAYAFGECSGLTSIEIPNSVTSIGFGAFCGCSSLDPHLLLYNNNTVCYGWVGDEPRCLSIEIPNSVTRIDDSAFSEYRHLISIEIPNSVTSIGEYAFEGCSSLNSIEIPNSVTSIGVYAFGGCSGLTSIEIPNSVTSIGAYAFGGCFSLKEINVETNNTRYSSLKGVLYSKDRVTLIKYPEGCKNKCFVLPEETLSIAEGALTANITQLFIHNHITSLGNFYNLNNIDEIHIRVEDPYKITFEPVFNTSSNGTLYVPVGTGYAYRHHPVFSQFKEIIIENEEGYRRKIETYE